MALTALVAGLLSTLVVVVDANGEVGGSLAAGQPSVYGPGHVVLALVLAGAGLAALVVDRGPAGAAVLGVVVLTAALLAGAGLVAFRKWPHYWGCCAPSPATEQDLVRGLALAMAVAGVAAAAAAVVALGARGLLARRHPESDVVLAVAAAVAVAVPPVVARGVDDGTDLVAGAVLYSLPFAAALAVSALLARAAALAVVGAAGGAAVAITLGDPFLDLNLPFREGLLLTVLALAAAAVVRFLVPDRRPVARAAHLA